MNTPISTPAYLCDKEKINQTEGLEGVLSFDGAQVTFKSSDNSKLVTLNTEQIKLADMNNIMASGQITFHATNDESYVFVFYKPMTKMDALGKSLATGGSVSVSRTTQKFSELSNTTGASKTWRDAMIASLPKEKLQYRKEVRPIRVLLIGLAVPILLIVTAVVVLNLLLG